MALDMLIGFLFGQLRRYIAEFQSLEPEDARQGRVSPRTGIVFLASLIGDYCGYFESCPVRPLGQVLAEERRGWEIAIGLVLSQESSLPDVCIGLVQEYLKFVSQKFPNSYAPEMFFCLVVSRGDNLQEEDKTRDQILAFPPIFRCQARKENAEQEVPEFEFVRDEEEEDQGTGDERMALYSCPNEWEGILKELKHSYFPDLDLSSPMFPEMKRKFAPFSLRAFAVLPDGTVCFALLKDRDYSKFGEETLDQLHTEHIQLAMWNPQEKNSGAEFHGRPFKVNHEIHWVALCFEEHTDTLVFCGVSQESMECLIVLTYTIDHFTSKYLLGKKKTKRPNKKKDFSLVWKQQPTLALRLGDYIIHEHEIRLVAAASERLLIDEDGTIFRWTAPGGIPRKTARWELLVPGLYLRWEERQRGMLHLQALEPLSPA